MGRSTPRSSARAWSAPPSAATTGAPAGIASSARRLGGDPPATTTTVSATPGVLLHAQLSRQQAAVGAVPVRPGAEPECPARRAAELQAGALVHALPGQVEI